MALPKMLRGFNGIYTILTPAAHIIKYFAFVWRCFMKMEVEGHAGIYFLIE